MYKADPKDPCVSPLLHKRIKDLPKTYISVCGHDTLRDDGALFKEALDQAGHVPLLLNIS
jgi:versiconal hemiacetal acetate esterase